MERKAPIVIRGVSIPRSFTEALVVLKSMGCRPSLYRRGRGWRAHVNSAGNFWADAGDPEEALHLAIEAWAGRGAPAEGDSPP